jgi:hypothetical protein
MWRVEKSELVRLEERRMSWSPITSQLDAPWAGRAGMR